MALNNMDQIQRRYIKHPTGQTIEILVIDHPACYAEVALQGGQLLKFYVKKHQQDLLWCTDETTFQPNKAIRGGIPLCFPWFGAHPTQAQLPSHGIARQNIWQLTEAKTLDAGEQMIVLSLKDSAETRKVWDYAFRVDMQMIFSDQLSVSLHTHNMDVKPFDYESALHTYYAISDIEKIHIKGLEGISFRDQLANDHVLRQESCSIEINKEIDRVYQDVKGDCIVQDIERRIEIAAPQCQSAVVWNPWSAKARALGDIQGEGWRKFVCIENGQIKPHTTTLPAGQSDCYQLKVKML